MNVPDETYNPDKTTGVADGDTLPVWSYNVETGEWLYETSDTVKMTNKGTYEVVTDMWHLSYWNWDWWWWWICTEALPLFLKAKLITALVIGGQQPLETLTTTF